uniref:Uncharacterized protein n=1 Tax=Myoviridae sp. ctt8G1 TaxID=2827713 RepID=A0A8S5TFZ3_9CAUD|nr:MAG TPA: hypothetical protein [Myoviridae sp. ctt8G1]
MLAALGQTSKLFDTHLHNILPQWQKEKRK